MSKRQKLTLKPLTEEEARRSRQLSDVFDQGYRKGREDLQRELRELLNAQEEPEAL